ncbi:MAG: hypothetical protein EAZ44_07275 [Cytophagia bacterium]|nr:MAG: hypothetical protein EAZ44_07275 [Cytophagia bacterium]TAG41645.1 MAG: hypothetical protein EAZ31_07255 [Cytophagia bacterium]TAH28327.1 MAG: hypothetical protein EAZ06_10375 [Cytophagales bacterium]
MQKVFFLFIFFSLYTIFVDAQPQNAKVLQMQINGNYAEAKYVLIPNAKRGRRLVKKDYVEIHIETRTQNDSVLRSTYPQNKPFMCYLYADDYPYATKGFMEEMLLLMHEGDSAIFWIDAQEQYQAIHKPLPRFLKKGDKIKSYLKAVKIHTIQEITRDKDAVLFKIKKENESILANHIAKNYKGKNFKKTYSGIWYIYTKETEGEFAKKDDLVSVKYSAKTLDGKEFGNSDTNGGHYEFPVGGKFTLPIFDEVMVLLKKGAAGLFFVPSHLAYGTQGGDGILPNTPIVMEIEFLDITLSKKVFNNPLEDERAELLKRQRQEKEKNKTKEQQEKEKQIEKESIKKLNKPRNK